MPVAAAAGATAELLAGNAPMLVKNRLQAMEGPASVSAAFKGLGPRSLTLGLGPQAAAIMCKRVYAYTADNALRSQPLLAALPPVVRGFASGAVVGAVEGMVFNPFRRLTAMQQVHAGTLRDAMGHLWKQEGPRGFAGGSLLNATRSSVAGMGYFGTLSASRALWPDAPSLVHGPLTGVAAGAVASMIGNPVDVLLTRRYTQAGTGGEAPRVTQILTDMWRREGALCLTRGASASLVRAGTAGLNYGAMQATLAYLTGDRNA